MNLLITGASGFIGPHLCRLAHESGHHVTAFYRREPEAYPPWDALISTTFESAFSGVGSLARFDVVIHLAGLAHRNCSDTLACAKDHIQSNLLDTVCLAHFCRRDNVRRFVFLSSIKVNGDFSPDLSPFTSTDPPSPPDIYSVCKHQSELALALLLRRSNTDYVIVRAPLVYGPSPKANMLNLSNLVRLGLPLPLNCLATNRRSLISVQNLSDFLLFVSSKSSLIRETVLVSDNDDVSTADLIREIARASSVPCRFIYFPRRLFLFLAKPLMRFFAIRSLTCSLQINPLSALSLGWTPPYSFSEGISLMFHQQSE